VCADGFLGDLRRALTKKLLRAAGFTMDRLTVTISNWMGNSFLTFVDVLEALFKREFNPRLGDFEIGAADHKWKEHKLKDDQSSSWCFSNMAVVEKICDLFKTVDLKGIRQTTLDKEVSACYKNIIALHNGDIVAVIPLVRLTHSKK